MVLANEQSDYPQRAPSEVRLTQHNAALLSSTASEFDGPTEAALRAEGMRSLHQPTLCR